MALRMTLEEAEAHQRRIALERQEREGRQKYGGPPARVPPEHSPAQRTEEQLADDEHEEQKAVVSWAEGNEEFPELEMLYAIPNAGKRTKRTRGRLKAEGMKAGVPDLCLPVPVAGYHGLYIEMKAATGSVRKEQKWWHDRLRRKGYYVEVCYGREQAKEAITNYLLPMH